MQFFQYIRGDAVFDDSDELAARINEDVQWARRAFAESVKTSA